MDPDVKPYQISIKAKGKIQPGLATMDKDFQDKILRKYLFYTTIQPTRLICFVQKRQNQKLALFQFNSGVLT